jgi:hypothetical protein
MFSSSRNCVRDGETIVVTIRIHSALKRALDRLELDFAPIPRYRALCDFADIKGEKHLRSLELASPIYWHDFQSQTGCMWSWADTTALLKETRLKDLVKLDCLTPYGIEILCGLTSARGLGGRRSQFYR